MTTLNQEQHRKTENARHWVAASAESQSQPERGTVRPNEAERLAESQRTGGDPMRIKAIRSWVTQGGPGRQMALILAALLIGVPVTLLVLEPLISVVVTVIFGIVMVRALFAGDGHAEESPSFSFTLHDGDRKDGHPSYNQLDNSQENPYNW
ncbi:hypothetical protein MA04_03904 [Alcanivorax balearicus MACL04]|uniref:Uncharacterized protein n=2 Tax=Alloalcanivorax TaxID=3020832 RepID=A0A9Q3ZES4_9GAMM|nr:MULTISPECIES: hypothetical protein [Alloalcanivorax]MCE7511020.1 hypothetical protein [Alloalcanivorax xenomutans]MCU5784604.1 hypothetical protein [Alloalcanivorax balearicus MACL04]